MTTLNVSELLSANPGTKKLYTVKLQRFEDKELDINPNQEVELIGYKIKDGVSLNPASQTITGKAVCGKCLREFEQTIELYPAEMQYYLKPPEEIEGYQYEMIDNKSFEIDVDDLLRESIFLNLPPVVKCKEDCLGICPVCGVNRNENQCNCVVSGAVSDTNKPFANLKDLIKE